MKDHLFFAFYWAFWANLLHLVFVQGSAPAMNVLQFVIVGSAGLFLLALLQPRGIVESRAKGPPDARWQAALTWVFRYGVLGALVWHGHMVLGALWAFQMLVCALLDNMRDEYRQQKAERDRSSDHKDNSAAPSETVPR